MNEFDRRWQVGAEEARKQPLEAPASMPLGFAGRVVAQWQPEKRGPVSLLSIWDTFSRRMVICLSVVLLITAIFSWPTDGQGEITRPPLEDTVSDLFSTL